MTTPHDPQPAGMDGVGERYKRVAIARDSTGKVLVFGPVYTDTSAAQLVDRITAAGYRDVDVAPLLSVAEFRAQPGSLQ